MTLTYKRWIHIVYKGCKLRDGNEPEFCKDQGAYDRKECDYYNCVVLNM